MENITKCLLRHLLTNYFTYREQCTLAFVCVEWYKILIFIRDAAECERLIDMLARLARLTSDGLADWKDHYDVYKLLCEPEYRLIFIHPLLRHARVKIIYNSHRHYCVAYNFQYLSISNSYAWNRRHNRLRDILIKLYKQVDTALILSYDGYEIDRYWSTIRRAIAPPADVSHEQWVEIFS